METDDYAQRETAGNGSCPRSCHLRLHPVPAGSSTGRSLFEPGYNDKIQLHEGQLGNWKHYLDDNPHRLAIKRLHPDLFTIIHEAPVAGRTCQMVGNRFLLDFPEMMAEEIARN